MKTITVNGYCKPGFEKVQEAFVNNFKKGKETGAAVAIVLAGQVVVDLWAGYADFMKKKP